MAFSSLIGFGWYANKGISSILDNLNTYQKKCLIALELYCKEACKVLESSAKRNRPWTDRTGDARRGLYSKPEINEKVQRLILGHGVFYGIYLEECNEKNYAVLMPTIQREGPGIVKGMNGLFDKVRVT